MRMSKFSEEQIIAILAEQGRGMATSEVCRHHSDSSARRFKTNNFGAKFSKQRCTARARDKMVEIDDAYPGQYRLALSHPLGAPMCVAILTVQFA